MSKLRITSQSVTEVIPSDSAFSEKYLQQTIEQKNTWLAAKQSKKASPTPKQAN